MVQIHNRVMTADANRGRILLVDDDPGLLRLLSIRLRAERYDVEAVESAAAALAALARFRPDLVVTDLRMERILRRAGWHLDRLGEPRQIGATKAVAGLLPITDDALGAIRATGKISGLAIDAPSSLPLAA